MQSGRRRGRIGRRLTGLGVLVSATGGLLLPLPAALAATSANQDTLYVTNLNGTRVTPIDQATGQTEPTISVGNAPYAIAITPNGQMAYVTNRGSNSVTPIDLATNTAEPAIAVGVRPVGIAITPNGQMAYVTNSGSNSVTPIDLATSTAEPAIAVGATPVGIAITPNGQTAYVANYYGGTVQPIDLATNTVEPAIAVGQEPGIIAITPNGQTAYVANYRSSTVQPIDLATNTAEKAIAVGVTPVGIAITPSGQTAYVANQVSSTVTPIDLTTNTAEPAIAVGKEPDFIATTPNGETAYVANDASNTVTPIDLATNTAEPAFAAGSAPWALAIPPDQAPVAQFTATPALAGQVTAFDAAASADATSAIAQYTWNFGDGTTETTSTPTTTHIYAAPGAYTVTLTETDAAGTSTTQVFTGQTVLRNGGPSATTHQTVAIAPALSGLSPGIGPLGTPVTLTGGFGTTVGAVYWTQNGTTVQSTGSAITAWTNTTIQTRVPAGLALGTVTAAVYNPSTGLLSGGQPFTVLTAMGGGSPPNVLTPCDGGSLSATGAGGTATATVPPNAAGPGTTCTLSVSTTPPGTLPSLPGTEGVVTLTATGPNGQPLSGLSAPVTLTLTGFQGTNPTVVAWNPLVGQWEPVSTAMVHGSALTWTTPQAGTFAVVPVGTVSLVQRLAGATRIQTAIQAAGAAYPNGSPIVILVDAGTGSPSPDALSAAGLAGALHAPILLTPTATLPADVLAAIQALHATTVQIVGGPAAVSDTVVTTLQQAGLTVAPRLSGADRAATALAVDQYLTTQHLTTATTVFVANATTLVDALSASPVLVQDAAPLLLVAPGQAALSPAEAAWLQQAGMTHAVILGGTAAVSAALQTRLAALPGRTVTRLGGATRNHTAIAIDQQYFPHPTAVVVAVNGTAGSSVVDALGAAPFAGAYGLPLVLTNPGSLPPSTAAYLQSVAPLGALWVMGGTAAVSSGVAQILAAHAGTP